jgi:hypothetical protein
MGTREVGKITKRVIEITGLNIDVDSPIYIGEQNAGHIKNKHPLDYNKYFHDIENILSNPTYIAKHPNKDSIEYIKSYKINEEENVLVAVRTSKSGIFFARTLFIMSEEKFKKYKEKGVLKQYLLEKE